MAMALAEFWWAERGHVFERWTADSPRVRPDVSGTPLGAGNWFAVRGRRFERRANAVLVPVGLVVALLYAWDDRGRSDRLVGDAGDVDAVVADPISDAAGWAVDVARWLWELGGERTVDWPWAVVIAIALWVAGVLAVCQLRDRMNPAARIRWMVGLLAAMVVAALLAPSGLELYALVFFLPLVGAANYERLSYKEIIALDRFLNERVKQIAPALDHALFRPWAVRVCVTPLSSTGSEPERDEWAETTRRMYEG